MSISKSLKALAVGGALGMFVASFGFSMSIAMGLFEIHMPTKEIKTSDVIIAQNYIDEQVTETRIEIAMYGDSSTKSYMDLSIMQTIHSPINLAEYAYEEDCTKLLTEYCLTQMSMVH